MCRAGTASSHPTPSHSWSSWSAGSDPGANSCWQRRREVQRRLRAGELPDFLAETADVRTAEWSVAPSAPDLTDRRVEITGPVERKMMINALNSGARVFMADFEDALSPPWTNVISGQANCMDAVRRALEYESPEGKRYALGEQLATLVVRPRGWHLQEKHILARRPARSPPAWWTSASTCSTTRESCSAAEAGPTSTCPSWRAISRPGCGTTSSTRPRTPWPSRGEPSGPPCWSRRSWRRSRWTRFCTSCGTTRPASTPAAGTTSSA